LLVLAVAIGVTISTIEPAQAAPRHPCVTAQMEEPFRLPNGMLYPAGALTLCDSRTFSPVGNLHKILVGGSNVGLFVSRVRKAEMRYVDSAQLLFTHAADGSLELVGYTVPKSGRSVAYRLKSEAATLEASSPKRSGGSSAAPVATIVAAAGTR
jgi:hypothetical protein